MSSLQNSLLIEFLSEELPPINLEKNIGNPFAEAVISHLSGFLNTDYDFTVFIAPRRFGLIVNGIKFEELEQQIIRKGPAINTALVDNQPTKALLGFAKSCGVEWQSLAQNDDGYFYFQAKQKGRALGDVIVSAIENGLKKIHIAKAMRWGNKDYQFVRPLHNLVVMLDDQVLECSVMGLDATNMTLGHRFMSKGKITIPHAQEYLSRMRLSGKVIASFEQRKQEITAQLNSAADLLGLEISQIDGLLDEVTALVEYPEVLVGEFDVKFLQVPQECLILSMAKNQKYFALLNNQGKLQNKFLFVANLKSNQPDIIVDGNQKVLTARLADAEFFYNFDKRTPLKEFVSKMENVVYHNKLGSQLDRIKRLQLIAEYIAPALNTDIVLATKAAYLLKADLVTEMVGEFPELQGVMGRYYAIASGESEEVANAIEKHYYPRFSGDVLPDSALATVVSLADKLETLVGIWGIGLIPTGDKDPYALRRAALGVVRILLESEHASRLTIDDILTAAFTAFSQVNGTVFNKNCRSDIYNFILQRLENYLLTIKNFPKNIVNSIMYSYYNESLDNPIDLIGVRRDGEFKAKVTFIDSLSEELLEFSQQDGANTVIQASKRMVNILKKNEQYLSSDILDYAIFDSASGKALFEHHFAKVKDLEQSFRSQDWKMFFDCLLTYNKPVEAFFNDVMVVTPDDQVATTKRLNCLLRLATHFNSACKLSELA